MALEHGGHLLQRSVLRGPIAHAVGHVADAVQQRTAADRLRLAQQGQCAPQPGRAGHAREALLGLLGGPLEAVDRQRRLAGAFCMLAGHRQELAAAAWGALAQPACRRAVAPLAFGFQQRVVGHLVQQVVVELALDGAFEVAAVAHLHESRPLQRRQGQRCVGVQRLQRVVPEDVANDAGLAGSLPFRGRQGVEPRLQQADQRARQAHGSQPIDLHRPVRLAGDDDPVVDEPAHQLLHVVRVALGLADDELDQPGWHRGDALQQRLHQQVALRRGQRAQRQPRLVRAPVGPARQ